MKTTDSDKWLYQRRPWGWMLKVWHSQRVWVKVLRVNTRTSLQYHNSRTEYHITFWSIKKIAPLEQHRMTKGWYIEIAIGNPRESDNTRVEDDFGRLTC